MTQENDVKIPVRVVISTVHIDTSVNDMLGTVLFCALERFEGGETIDALTELLDDNVDQFEMNVDGVLTRGENQIEIEYAETALTGMEGCHTKLSFHLDDRNFITMQRIGPMHHMLIFEAGKQYTCYYQTEYLQTEVMVMTKKIKNDLTETGGDLFIDYIVSLKNSPPRRTKLRIRAFSTI